MENYIVINGKKAELTEEQLEKLGIKTEKNKYEDLFGRREVGAEYFHITRTGDINIKTDYVSQYDDKMFECANYCADREILHQRALHETLNRLLWRASVIAGEMENPWDGDSRHYTIVYDTDCQDFAINHYRQVKNGVIHFPSSESALIAIENIVKPFLKEHPDFKW